MVRETGMRTVTSDCVAGKSWRVSLNIMLNIRTSFKIAMMATGTDMTAISMRLDLPWLRLLQIAMMASTLLPAGLPDPGGLAGGCLRPSTCSSTQLQVVKLRLQPLQTRLPPDTQDRAISTGLRTHDATDQTFAFENVGSVCFVAL